MLAAGATAGASGAGAVHVGAEGRKEGRGDCEFFSFLRSVVAKSMSDGRAREHSLSDEARSHLRGKRKDNSDG